MTLHDSTPVWDSVKIPRYNRPLDTQRYDVVIVGGGITGLSAAYFLKRAGKRVCVLERDRLGQGDTGHTTAHLTYVTDVRLHQLVKTFGKERAALAWHAGGTALDLIEQVVADNNINCQFRRTPGFLHASLDRDQDESESLQAEAELAQELGFAADFVAHVPVVDRPGIRFRDQAKFQPRAYLAALARLVDGDGSSVHEEVEVTGVGNDDPIFVEVGDRRIDCGHVVIGTHVPIMGKNGLISASFLQSRLAAYSSYVVSGRLPRGAAPDVSLWDTSNPYYYLRIDEHSKYARAIFGGKDHKTGQETDTEVGYLALTEKLQKLLPEVEIDYCWSGQVIDTNDGLPLIGETSPRQFIATGYNGNGITFATIAATMARDAVLGRDNPWADLFAPDRRMLGRGALDYLKQNMDYPYYLVADRLGVRAVKSAEEIQPGEGKVLKVDGHPTACSRDEHGKLHRVSAVCTHLGCLVRWNGAEQTWDCPCHGSRFRPTGEVLSGPAETPLEAVDAPQPAAQAP